MGGVGVEGTQNHSLVPIYSESRSLSIPIQNGKGLDYGVYVIRLQRQVISGSPNPKIGERRKFEMKDVVTKNKKEGGEGTTLLNPSLDCDLVVWGDRRGDDDVGEEVEDGVDEPRREPLLGEGGQDKVMVNGIESLAIVREEDKEVLLSHYLLIIGLVETTKVIRHQPLGKEHFLVSTNQSLRSINHRDEESSSDDPVPGVVDGDRAGILDQKSVFFGKKEEGGRIEVPQLGGRPFFPKKNTNIQQDGPREGRQCLVGAKRDAIGSGRGIGGEGDGLEDGVEGDVADTVRVNLPFVLGEVRLEVSRSVASRVLLTPNLRVVVGDDSASDGRIGGGWATRVTAQSNNLGARGRQSELEFFENVEFFGGGVRSQTGGVLMSG